MRVRRYSLCSARRVDELGSGGRVTEVHPGAGGVAIAEVTRDFGSAAERACLGKADDSCAAETQTRRRPLLFSSCGNDGQCGQQLGWVIRDGNGCETLEGFASVSVA
jgi:hypothetical protein